MFTNSDSTARLWDASSGALLRVFSGHSDVVTSVAFAPNGEDVLTGSEDGTARLWESDWRVFAQFTCQRLFRDFTPEERQRYNILDTAPTCAVFARN